MKRLTPVQLTLIGAAGLAILVLVTPLFVKNNYTLSVLSFVAINTILALGLNLLMGYAGQVSLGHAAFYGLGAYTSAILTTQHHVSPWLALLLGILLTSGVAWLIGIPCLRLRGHYLAMATLGVGWIVYIVMVHWDTVTLGTSGIDGIPKLTLGSLTIDTDVRRFYLTWTVAILTLILVTNLVHSRVGRALRALHSSELAAATLGVDVARFKVQVFVLSAGLAAFAGSLYAHTVHFISPSCFGFNLSVELVVMVVVGGMASVWGAIFGAGFITALVEWLRSLGEAVHLFKEFDVIAHGAILVLAMIFVPAGITCGTVDLFRKLLRRRTRPVVDKEADHDAVA
jgi:branched-chain amino acid transport system permease protein